MHTRFEVRTVAFWGLQYYWQLSRFRIACIIYLFTSDWITSQPSCFGRSEQLCFSRLESTIGRSAYSVLTPLQEYPSYGAGHAFSVLAIAEYITLACLVISFILFLILAIRFRHSEGGILHSFKLQLSVAILLWIVGEIVGFAGPMLFWKMCIHTTSMSLFAIVLLYRIRGLAGR